MHTDGITEEDIIDIEDLQNAVDDAYNAAQNNAEGYMEKAAYAIIAREISSITLSSKVKGSQALRYSTLQSNIQSVAHALSCDLA